MPNTNKPDNVSTPMAAKKPFETPTVTYVGHIDEIVQAGGGKLSPSAADPGDARKPSGLDH
jgi:hypothetical protein